MPTPSSVIATCECCGWTMNPWWEELLVGMPSKCRACGSKCIELKLSHQTEKIPDTPLEEWLRGVDALLAEIETGHKQP
jgi:hypothetical protein